MSVTDHSNHKDILAKLAQSRAEIRRLLEPAPREPHYAGPHERAVDESFGDSFPRSRTMKLLLSGRGLGTVGAVAGGLLLARPALAFRAVRMLPLGAVARMLMVKALTALRTREG